MIILEKYSQIMDLYIDRKIRGNYFYIESSCFQVKKQKTKVVLFRLSSAFLMFDIINAEKTETSY